MRRNKKAFVFEAGKIILAISILLWIMASYGPGEDFSNAEEIVQLQYPDLSGWLQRLLDYQIDHLKLRAFLYWNFGKIYNLQSYVP